MRGVGLDFGTTNSAIGVADERGVRLAKFAHREGLGETFRSVLYFHPDEKDERNWPKALAGPQALDRYLEAEGNGRLLQSLKSYLADRGFVSTSVFSRMHSLVDLLALLLVDLRGRAEKELGPLGERIVVGRPVHFAHASGDEGEELAIERLRTALGRAGFTDVIFEYEPVAAAYYYESTLTQDELVLVADFGGGTSDFSLVEVGPTRRGRPRKILGNDGVGLAGDALDAKIIHHVVAPALGMGGTYRAMFGRELDVPVWLYTKLRRWHHLSFLKSKKTIELLEEIVRQSDDPSKVEAFLHILEYDLGYHLYRAVERAKVALSASEETRFAFADRPVVDIEKTITRSAFDGWIQEETDAMAASVDRLLATTGVGGQDVSRVFMTGGTSFVPAVRRLFDERFGADKIRAGGEMVSVATGLALRATST